MPELADYQHEILDYLASNKRGALLATMGARKTTTSIEHCIRSGFDSVLIVVPANNVATWAQQFDEWYPKEEYIAVMGDLITKVNRINTPTRFLICSYPTLSRRKVQGKIFSDTYDALKRISNSFDCVIFDEAYTLGAHNKPRFKDIRRIISPIDNRIIMDGEITAEGIKKLYGPFLMLDDGETFGRDWYAFMNKYFYQPQHLPFPKWVERKGSEQKVRSILAARSFIYTEDDLRASTVGLPDQINYVIKLPMTLEQTTMVERLKKEWVLDVKGKEKDIKFTMEMIAKLRQIMDGFVYTDDGVVRVPTMKTKALIKALNTSLKHKKKIVVWGAFTESLNIIKECFTDPLQGCVVYHGSLSIEDRVSVLYQFVNDPTIRGIAIQVSCGVGLNELVCSNVAYYYSNSEKRRDRAQSEKRTTRPTQKAENTYCIDAFIVDSYEEKIYNRLQDKGEKSYRLLSLKEMRKELKK